MNADHNTRYNRQVAGWLLFCCLMVFAMVVLGGLTRLTGSGLSMVKWEPVVGILPPTSTEDWQTLFQLYQATPEYKLVNHRMELEGFKGIFWLEYIHRVVGRLIGLVFFIPLLYFIAIGALRGQLIWQTTGIFLLGGLQGGVGWIMVKSGLSADPHVSPYLLTGHLLTALLIHSLLFWLALGLLYPSNGQGSRSPAQPWAWLVTLLSLVTIASGGFVAGLKAGMVYNTFPMMGDHWFPLDYFLMDSALHNLFENPIAAQFNHRLLALLTFTVILLFWFVSRKWRMAWSARIGIHLLAAMAVVQVILGISTLLLFVPIGLAATHQAGAVVVLTLALFVTHRLVKGEGERGITFN